VSDRGSSNAADRGRRRRWRTFVHRVQRFLFKTWQRTVGRPATRVGLVIAVLAVASAAGLHYFEKMAPGAAADNPYSTLSGTFLSVIVLLVSGFDVYPPASTPGWVCAIFTMLLGIGLVALVTADLASHLVRVALRARGTESPSVSDHYVVCGWGRDDPFILQSLTSDAVPVLRHVVVLDEELDGYESPDPYVHYVKGSPTDEEALERAGISDAETTLIPLDWQLSDEALRDSLNTLIMLAVEAKSPNTYTCVEVYKPDSKRHLGRTRADEVICAGELARRTLTQAALNHGLSLFLGDLLTLDVSTRIHKEVLPTAFAGMPFRRLFDLLNEHLEEILLAVERGRQIYTNPPGDFPLLEGDGLFMLGACAAAELTELADAFERRELRRDG
jgi:voltage-gated potassium channel